MTNIAEEIRKQGRPFYLICTGGGAGLQQRLWNAPGISSVLLGAEFPYAKEATDACLGFEPSRYSSPETAVDLAMAAFYKAVSKGVKNPVGLGLTATVATTRAHRGDHRAFVATISDEGCRLTLAKLEKGEGPVQREKDGKICDSLAMGALLQGLGFRIGTLPSFAEEFAATLAVLSDYRAEPHADGFAEERFFAHPYFEASGKRLPPSPLNGLILPGAFNPPHEGHFNLAKAAQQQYPLDPISTKHVTFAVTQKPPHKEALTVAEMLRRAKYLEGHDRVFTRNDPFFIDKARQNPGASFIIGVDTLERLLDPKWGPSVDQLCGEFVRLGTRFYVAGRTVNGRFRTLEDVAIPPQWWRLRIFHHVPGRWDISSSELRAKEAS